MKYLILLLNFASSKKSAYFEFPELPEDSVMMGFELERPVVKSASAEEDDDFAKPFIELDNQAKLFEKM